ncbi:MAG TPA: rhodanese-like domain-containing protein [Hyphomicrobium sp.]|nr:rhodanese-like domain-containing protein [Hyphomicrobium sp.]
MQVKKAAHRADGRAARLARLIRRAGIFAAILAAGAFCAEADEKDASFDPVTGYRIAHYRAAVPETVTGGTRVDLDRVDVLIKEGAILLDVMPSEGAGPDPATGEWRLSRPHSSIPGSTWLPDVGRGRITPAFENYLERNLEMLTKGDKAHAIIVFCQSDCWMAWNAVQRISLLGYSTLYWFPEGTDGWVEWGDRKLTPATPVTFSEGRPGRD